jgi:ABC-2 type transport system permease protein
MLQAIWALSRARLRILRNTFWRGRLRTKLATALIGAAGAFGAVVLYNFTGAIVQGLRSPEFARLLREAAATTPGLPADATPFLAALPATVLLAALTLLVFSSFSALLSSLFLAGDIDMLLVAPVPMRAVFVVKFFGALGPQYLLLLLLLAPVLLGYGRGMGYGPLYHLCALLALLLTPLLPAGLSALLVLAVVRVLPPRRAREIVSLLGGLIGLGFYLLSQLGAQVGSRVGNPANLGALLVADTPLLPSAWAARALVAAGENRPPELLAYGGLFLGASTLVFGGCLLLAERLYYIGWSNLAAEGAKPRAKRQEKRPDPRAGSAGALLAILPQQSRAILAKDLRLFSRDLRNLQALIFPLSLAAIWTYQLFAGERPGPRGADPGDLAFFEELAGAAIAFFVCLSLSSALAGPGVSREGKQFWLLKLAPLPPWRLLLGKFALAFLPFPLVGTVFLIVLGIVRATGPAVLLQQWALLLICGVGCAAFGTGIGAAFPRLDWENPSQQTTWRSGCLSAIFYPLYLMLVIGLIAGGTLLADLLGGGLAGVGVRLLGWAIAALLTGAVAWLSVLVGTRGLEAIEV